MCLPQFHSKVFSLRETFLLLELLNIMFFGHFLTINKQNPVNNMYAPSIYEYLALKNILNTYQE